MNFSYFSFVRFTVSHHFCSIISLTSMFFLVISDNSIVPIKKQTPTLESRGRSSELKGKTTRESILVIAIEDVWIFQVKFYQFSSEILFHSRTKAAGVISCVIDFEKTHDCPRIFFPKTDLRLVKALRSKCVLCTLATRTGCVHACTHNEPTNLRGDATIKELPLHA